MTTITSTLHEDVCTFMIFLHITFHMSNSNASIDTMKYRLVGTMWSFYILQKANNNLNKRCFLCDDPWRHKKSVLYIYSISVFTSKAGMTTIFILQMVGNQYKGKVVSTCMTLWLSFINICWLHKNYRENRHSCSTIN